MAGEINPVKDAAAAQRALDVWIEKSFSPASKNAFRLAVRFRVPPGVTILFGPSGSGKTTALDCIAGLLRPERGRIALGDRVLFDSAEKIRTPPRRRRIGYVFQNLALFPHLSVEENVAYGLREGERGDGKERLEHALKTFRIEDLRTRRPDEISGGERQRVALARSLVSQPEVLLLDEPLAALDHATKRKIMEELRSWNESARIAVLYVTHSHQEVFEMGERLIVLEGGKVLAEGDPQEVLWSPQHETVANLAGFENIFGATVGESRTDQGSTRCRLENSALELEVPFALCEVGTRVRVAVRAGDILLATSPLTNISARNILPGTLKEMRRVGTRVVARVACGAEFLVELTPASCKTLRLAAGQTVWLAIKTHSCHVLPVGD